MHGNVTEKIDIIQKFVQKYRCISSVKGRAKSCSAKFINRSLFLLCLSVLVHVLGAVDFSAHGKIGNFIIHHHHRMY